MTKNRLVFIIALLVSVLLLTACYLWLWLTRPDSLMVLLLASGLALCLVSGLAAGRVAALLSGVLVGFFSTWRIYHPELVLLPVSRDALSALLSLPGLASGCCIP
jgi:hypothetical protein